MQHEIKEASRSDVNQLYKNNMGTMLNMALSSGRLFAPDGERIVNELAKHLHEYQGQSDDQEFITWAEQVILPAATRLEFFYELWHQHRRSILAGVWSILRVNADLADHSNLSYIAEGIAADTWCWVFKHLDDLMIAGDAKLGTRLHAQGKFHALTWRKSRLRALERFDDAPVQGFGDGFVDGNGVVVAANGILSSEPSRYFDPGCHEDGVDEELRQRPKSRPLPSPTDAVLAMKSGRPRILCASCKSLQAITPAPASKPEAMTLQCGHERLALLPAA